jgi:hypothetical protein
MNYFNKLPTITYDGQLAKNLLARAKLSDETRDNRLVFQRYTMNELDRVDVLSNYYYDSPGYSWLVWFSNDIIDPYYDMPMTEIDFNRYLEAKYGSVEVSMRKIEFYRFDWISIDTILTPQQFAELGKSSLGKIRKYYKPVLDMNLIPVQYVVDRKNYTVATNRIEQITINNISGTFVVGEEIQVSGSVYATVASVGNDYLICKHIVGGLLVGNIVTGQTSSARATITLVPAEPLTQNIDINEVIYWKPVTAFEYENELNELKKEIKLLDVRFKSQAESDLKRLMSR